MARGKIIFHIDMNSFYASVEIADDPSLKGKPLAIAGDAEERRGIIVTSSYEARAKGVKTTMPVWKAKRLCPELIIRKPNFHKYREASKQIFSLLYEYTPLVEPVSIDEGYLDVTDSCKHLLAPALAKEIQSRLLQELNLPCSIGIAPNKFLAKMASDFKKPLGITILRKREIANKLWPLPLIVMHGVGKKTEEKLKSLGLETIGDLAKADPLILKHQLGLHGVKIYERANGHDDRLVDPDSIYDYKSVGNSTTLREDSTDEQTLKAVFTNLAHEVGRRLRQKRVCAQNIQITIRNDKRKTTTRSRKLESPIQTNDEILQAALFLWKKYWNGEPVRLLGITAHDLVEEEFAYKQLDLFTYEEDVKQDHLAKTIDSIRKKFGEESLLLGRQLGGDRSELIRDRKRRGTSLEKDFLQCTDKKE